MGSAGHAQPVVSTPVSSSTDDDHTTAAAAPPGREQRTPSTCSDVDSKSKRRKLGAISDSGSPEQAAGRRVPTGSVPPDSVAGGGGAAAVFPEAQSTWMGSVRLLDGEGRPGAELCGVSIQLPSGIISEFPASELIVSGLVPRKGVMISGRLTCATMITQATVQQMQQLRKMAEQELVALVPLQVGQAVCHHMHAWIIHPI